MRVVIAIDSFKGCLASREAGEAACRGVLKAWPTAQVTVLPVSDGGDGLLDAFVAACGADVKSITARDALMRAVEARFAAAGNLACVEVAQAAGLSLLKSDERDAMHATSFGVGQLLKAAARWPEVVVGLGGTATSDAGVGMMQALGLRFFDNNGDEMLPGQVDLERIAAVDKSGFLLSAKPCRVVVASDVRNPLYGPQGAAHVFAPQKGASPAEVERLDAGMRNLARVMRPMLGDDVALRPGAGAAGGMGYALMALFDAQFVEGAKWMLDLLNFDKLVDGADMVITGEGSADEQTLMGKLPSAVMRVAQAAGVPTLLVAGRVRNADVLRAAGFTHVQCINDPDTPLHIAMRPDYAAARLTHTTADTLSAHNIGYMAVR